MSADPRIPTAVVDQEATATAKTGSSVSDAAILAGYDTGSDEFREVFASMVGSGIQRVAESEMQYDLEWVYGMALLHGMFIGARAARAADREATGA